MESVWDVLEIGLYILVGIFVLLFIIHMIRMLFEILQARRLVYIKVTLPRADSKLDKERETKKDFKEKMATMSGVYKSLHGMGNVSLKDTIVNFFFQHIKVSFELVFHDGELHFYLVTYKTFFDLVSQQVTANYPDAEVLAVDPLNELFSKK